MGYDINYKDSIKTKSYSLHLCKRLVSPLLVAIFEIVIVAFYVSFFLFKLHESK